MDIEEVNEEYKYFVSRLENMKTEAKELEERAITLEDDRVLAQAKVIVAKRNNDKASEEVAKKEIEEIEKQIINVKEEAIKRKEKVQYLKEKVEQKINELRENPEVKEQIDNILKEKYEKKNKDLYRKKEQKEKLKKRKYISKKLDSKRKEVQSITRLLARNNDLYDNIKQIMKIRNEVEDLVARLSADNTSADEKREIQSKLLPEKSNELNHCIDTLRSIIIRDKIKYTEIEIIEFFKEPARDEHGNIDVDLTMNKKKQEVDEQIELARQKRSERIDREIEQIDKKIQYNKAIMKSDKTQTDIPQNNNRVVNNNNCDNLGGNNKQHKKHFWSLFKRFIMRKSNDGILPAPPTENPIIPQKDDSTVDMDKQARKFREDLAKYEIVGEAVRREENERIQNVPNRDGNTDR